MSGSLEAFPLQAKGLWIRFGGLNSWNPVVGSNPRTWDWLRWAAAGDSFVVVIRRAAVIGRAATIVVGHQVVLVVVGHQVVLEV